MGIARPVPMAPMVNITRTVNCTAVMSVSVACAGSIAVSANKSENGLRREAAGHHRNAADHVQRVLRNVRARPQHLHGRAHRERGGKRGRLQIPAQAQAISPHRQRQRTADRAPRQRTETDVEQHAETGGGNRAADGLMQQIKRERRRFSFNTAPVQHLRRTKGRRPRKSKSPPPSPPARCRASDGLRECRSAR